jgi:hypothetical protein
MKTPEQTAVLTIQELQAMQHIYRFDINEEDYQMYLNIVKAHNKAKKESKHLLSGDAMIAEGIDNNVKYVNGHIERNKYKSDSYTVCTQHSTPFVNGGHGETFHASASGGYWFVLGPDEEIEHAGFRSKEFCAFGRNGAKGDGAFCFNLIVNVWKVVSEQVY